MSVPVEVSRSQRLRPLVGVLAGFGIAQLGSRIAAIALPWFVLVSTGSAAQTGLVAFCEMAPYVLAKALSGPVVDRIGPRVVSWTTDLVSALSIGLVPLLDAAGALPFPMLLALVALVGATRGPGDLAKQVLIPEAAERSAVPLERATGISGAMERLASTAGALAGGGLVALIGPLAGLGFNAACFVLGSVIIGLTLPRGMGRAVPAEPGSEGEERGYWGQLAVGFHHLRRTPLLLTLAGAITLTNLLDAALVAVLLPVWANETGFGPSAIGLLGAAMGTTAILGSVIAASFAHRLRRRPVLVIGIIATGLPRYLALAWALTGQLPLWGVAAVFAVCGFGAGFLNPIIGALAIELVPRPLLGRVTALFGSLAWAGIPLGGVLGGLAVAGVGVGPVLVACAVLYLLPGPVIWVRPEWRAMERARRRQRTDATDATAGTGTEAEGGDGSAGDAEDRGRLAT
ncbi:MFS transporter [Streptomyces profundus]|uniref:MFS transporter n=1 Tax=Streptomyces profundus TaxID=2867410 RepID=UPI001D165236|nr:MFS transporter [Streptomyces sp. MA3_2.13]UED84122.1 MFS transporter [Streptomyces sp. MA3_2.13]